MTNPWKPTNRMTDDTVMHDAIGKIREASDKRREVEARVLAENNLASVRQLSEDKKKKFCAIVDALIAEQADVNVQLFPENDQDLVAAASQIKTTTWGTITESADLQELSTAKMQAYRKAAHKDVANKAISNMNNDNWKEVAPVREKIAKRYVSMNRAAREVNRRARQGVKEEVIDSVDEGILATGIAAGLGAWGASKIMKNKNLGKKAVRALTGRKEAAKRAAALDHPIRKAALQSRSLIHGKASADKGMSSFVSKMAGKNQYDKIADGERGLRFGTRKEEIMEAILEMEGLYIDQLTESGLYKLEAIAEQVILDEENEKKNVNEDVELEEGAIGDIIRSHVRPIKQKWDAQAKELKRRSVHAFSKPGSWEHKFSHPNAMHNPGHDPEKHNYDGKSFTHHVHLHDTKGDAGNVSKFKVVARNDKDAVEAAKYDHSEFSDAHPHELKVVHIHHVMHEDLDEEKKKLNELSKATLSRYIVKAHTSGTTAAADQENAFMRGAKRNKDRLRKAGQTGEKREQGIQRAAHQLSYKKEDTVEEGIKEKIGGMIRRRSTLTPGQTRRDYASGKQSDALAAGKPRSAERYGKWIDKDRKRYGSHTPPRPNSTNEAYEPRGERDVGDKKQPTGVPNKKVDAATLADRKLVKKNGGRFPDNNSY